MTAAPSARARRIALVAEGCYPFVTGGVSTWCDQLIRGLPDHDFEVVALTATRIARPAFVLPTNVTRLRQVPLWAWTGRQRTPGAGRLAVVLGSYRSVLVGMLSGDHDLFAAGLRGIFEAAQEGTLVAAMQTDDAVRVLTAAWQAHEPHAPLTLRDALGATELLQRMLGPLGAPVVQADVLHPVSNGLPVLPALAALWRHGTPYVISEHGVYLRERYLGAHQVSYSWPVKTLLLAFFRELCRLGYDQASVIAPVNVYNRRWEVRHGADPDRIATAYNGVRPEDLPPADGEPDVPTVGWVGRVDPLKDLETLVEGFAVVRERVPGAVLRLFGPTPAGNEDYAATVRARITELGLDDAVTFEGPVRPVSSAYHRSSVVVLSSISEGLPYTVMEAMMCGRATVSTGVGGVPEVAGDAGVVVPPRDPKALGHALADLLLDDARRADLGVRARERALRTFPLDLMLERFRTTYAELATPRVAARTAVRAALPAPLMRAGLATTAMAAQR
ncbi:MAG TPA: GT4 family glycosyltransferase PelF [Kineosporiaceae bacterium]|nr:GT4 family glycosyltransferase PelF [Kineosporiaceae bacterium]